MTKSLASEPARIGILSWDFASPRGGLGRAMHWLHEALVAHGVSSVVASPFPPPGQRAMLRRTGMRGGHLLFSLLLPFVLQRWIDAHGITTLLLPAGPGGIFLWFKPKRCRIFVMSYHTYWQQSRLVPGESWKWMLALLERHTLSMADKVLYAAEDTAVSLHDEYHLDREMLHLIVPIFPLESWEPTHASKEPWLCVCIARLDKRKGIDVLLEAWRKLTRTMPEAKLVLVGKPAGLKGIVEWLRADTSVTHYESLPEQEIRALVAKASLALCPSYLEGFGLFAAEAMASGTAVIASDSEGLRSLLKHQTSGWLVESGNADAWAQAMGQLLKDHALRESIAAGGQREAHARLRQDKAIEGWISLLTQHDASPST